MYYWIVSNGHNTRMSATMCFRPLLCNRVNCYVNQTSTTPSRASGPVKYMSRVNGVGRVDHVETNATGSPSSTYACSLKCLSCFRTENKTFELAHDVYVDFRLFEFFISTLLCW